MFITNLNDEVSEKNYLICQFLKFKASNGNWNVELNDVFPILIDLVFKSHYWYILQKTSIFAIKTLLQV